MTELEKQFQTPMVNLLLSIADDKLFLGICKYQGDERKPRDANLLCFLQWFYDSVS